MDLFSSLGFSPEGVPKPDGNAPLAVRMRPASVGDVMGQEHLLLPGAPLARLLDESEESPPSVVLWGPPGSGKTTLAYLIALQGKRKFQEISAVSGGVKEVRSVIAQAREQLATTGQQTVLFIDEVHRFSKTQQDALLPAVENHWVVLVAATTENPSFSVIPPLLSRSLLLVLNQLGEEDVVRVLERALESEDGYGGAVSIEGEAQNNVLRMARGDARKALTLLEAAATAAENRGSAQISANDVALGASVALVHMDQDQHYDVASAFIKSMRGSDVDASLHYLARMLEGGEDPRFVARRVMICAAEDVGMADPSILPLTVAAAQAVALVGMPEARIILSQAVIAVATAPKSNAAYLAIDAAIADIREGKSGEVPPHLRDGHYQGAAALGHGEGYIYSHDAPHGVARQSYLPENLADAQYYRPLARGEEALIAKRMQSIETWRSVR